jgi:hypothetical protein
LDASVSGTVASKCTLSKRSSAMRMRNTYLGRNSRQISPGGFCPLVERSLGNGSGPDLAFASPAMPPSLSSG